jgi:HAD superfamily 5'-nucleotidase-like hydrolase
VVQEKAAMSDRIQEILGSVAERPRVQRGIFCNRTLNLRAIKSIGYDMDYTLVHYNVEHWERTAYGYLRQKLVDQGWPVGDLEFDPRFITRGLIMDRELGNIVKANRFGYVKQAYHGTNQLDFDSQREAYARTIIDLAEDRWRFLNTLFAISEACMYAQLVDMLATRRLPEVLGYGDLYNRVRNSLDQAHAEGQLKAEIIANPERFVERDPDLVLALLDQRRAGKRLMLITNSEWGYTNSMMAYAFDEYLPPGTIWRDLFELIIVAARKPDFFSARAPIFEVVDEEGLLRPCGERIPGPGCYLGGHAAQVEAYLGCSGAEILYVGDHLYGDVRQSKNLLRWRTALIMPELEAELEEVARFEAEQEELSALMEHKIHLEYQYSQLRLMIQRKEKSYGPPVTFSVAQLQLAVQQLRKELLAIDLKIGRLAKAAGELHNQSWGLLMRTGNDKSHMARQVERHADIYMSRVSNFLFETPFVYLRSPRGSLPHDPLPSSMRLNGAQ